MSLCATGPAARPPDIPREATNSKNAQDESGIRERLEACRQGMIQLDILRSRHLRMMEDMRGRLPLIPSCGDVRSREKKFEPDSQQRESIRSEDSGRASVRECVHGSRAQSPLTECVSHRSSMSVDSGCSSVRDGSTDTLIGASLLQPPCLTYTAFRKQSLEEAPLIVTNIASKPLASSTQPRITPRARKAINFERKADSSMEPCSGNIHLLSTTIESTTSLRRNHPNVNTRPRSMYATYESTPMLDQEELKRKPRSRSPPILDSRSFSALTPPPIQRKFGVIQKIPTNCGTQDSPKPAPRKQIPTQEVSPIQTETQRSAQIPGSTTLEKYDTSKTLPMRRQVINHDEDLKSSIFHAARIFLAQSPKTQKRRFLSQDPTRIRPKSMFENESRDADSIIFSAQPVKVLSRQASHATPETSPTGVRRLTVAAGIARFEAHAGKQPRPSRRDKPWHESKAL